MRARSWPVQGGQGGLWSRRPVMRTEVQLAVQIWTARPRGKHNFPASSAVCSAARFAGPAGWWD